MSEKLSFEVVWYDEDLIEIEVVGINESFRGSTQVYTTSDHLNDIAKSLEGFPKKTDDRIEVKFGDVTKFSSVVLDFYCYTGAGSAIVYVELVNTVNTVGSKKHDRQSVALAVRFEAAAIDRFVSGIRRIAKNIEGKAELILMKSF